MDVVFEDPVSQDEMVADTQAMLRDDPNIFSDVGATADPDSVTATSQQSDAVPDGQLVDITWISQ